MFLCLLISIDRFGEESLHSCEVMLKDVEDAKRINNTIRSEWNKNEQQQQQQSQTVDENKVYYLPEYYSIIKHIYVCTFLPPLISIYNTITTSNISI